MANQLKISKNMPSNTLGPTDRSSTFALGRRAFFSNSHSSHQSTNLPANIDYSYVINNNLAKKSSITYGKPVNIDNGGLRTQRLRLTAIGSGSSKVNDESSKVYFDRKDPDYNYNYRALSRVRAGGAIAPKEKGNKTTKFCT